MHTLNELERAAYMAGDIAQADLYAALDNAPDPDKLVELQAEKEVLEDALRDKENEADGYLAELRQLRGFLYDFYDLELNERTLNNPEIIGRLLALHKKVEETL